MAASAKPHNEGLHLVRGLCALGVAAYHYLSWEHGIAIESAGAFLVYIFFILSALAMMMVYAKAFASGLGSAEVLDFYRKRVARILPLLAGTAVLSLVLGTLSSGWDVRLLGTSFLTGSGLFGLQMPGMNSSVVAAWSLGIEAVFYLVFPIVALLCANALPRHVIGALVVFIIGQQAAITVIEDRANFWFYYANPLVFAPFFGLGVLIYLRPVAVRKVNLWLSVGALIAVAGFSLLFPLDVYRNPAVYLSLTAGAGVAVLTAYSAEMPNWISKPSRLLGNISYALYLTHWFTFTFGGRVVDGLGITEPTIRSALLGAAALAVAYCVYRFFEVPMRAWIRGRTGVPSSSPQPHLVQRR